MRNPCWHDRTLAVGSGRKEGTGGRRHSESIFTRRHSRFWSQSSPALTAVTADEAVAREQRGQRGKLPIQLWQNSTLALWRCMERKKLKKRSYTSNFADVLEPLRRRRTFRRLTGRIRKAIFNGLITLSLISAFVFVYMGILFSVRI